MLEFFKPTPAQSDGTPSGQVPDLGEPVVS